MTKNTEKWTYEPYKHSIRTVKINSWKYFHDFIQEEFLDFKTYVFRGQSNENWELEPTINRFFKEKNTVDYTEDKLNHLNKFKYSLRGRTPNLRNIINDENEIWALGQHHGLSTPMLDFSSSPYVAAYFAFFEDINLSEYRTIYALHESTITDDFKGKLSIYKPHTDHNPRLINQSGLFVKFDTNSHIEEMFEKKFPEDHKQLLLFKIKVPNKDREICLRLLNRMNINHNTLFPDLQGASIYCNMELTIKDY